ncbi:PTS IIA-like nitrogen-regulatory protein PtsN [Pseudoalteromonas phenolica]|uniref:PTS IIA-like nitrogen-regulatory protein PtsN n=1 Tax=Pseudoalteromonas phenolica TaxID=161398 RepID=A0A4Q7IPV0_9GAMM|nr:PTS IIA-like nitrogen regulatory protein PtsN [Pseudoalteromonas phenolica]RZQ53127.1 PTS IIA-like nitrogen-regulatory protein PtsN [Pseudoalteromonas phenolica]
MKLSSIINKDCSKAAVLFNSKKRALEYISELASQHLPDHNAHEILDAFLTREKLGSTGIGKGIAIPHGRLKGIDSIFAILVTNQNSINFDAIDNRPVDILLAMLVPEGDNASHLKTLAEIAGKLNNKEFCKQLRQAPDDDALYQVIQLQD